MHANLITPPAAARRGFRWWWAALAAGLLVLLLAGWGWQRHRAAQAALATEQANQFVVVARGSVEKSVESSGKVVSNLDIDIKCRASGEVVTLPFDISQTVKKGDLLCQLDPTDEQLAVRSAEAQLVQTTAKLAQAKAALQQAEQNLLTTRQRTESALASAKVKADNARAKAEREKTLVDQQLGSQEEYETAQTAAAAALADQRAAEVAVAELKQQEIQLDSKRQEVILAESALVSTQIALDTQRQQLGYTTVTAPIDGTVSALNVQRGTIIASGVNAVDGGTTIMTLSDLSRVFVMASVDESDIGGVLVDQVARITVDSFPGQAFVGKVVRVAVKGETTSNVVTFEVKVEVMDEQKHLLKPEMTGNVIIVQEKRDNALLVPVAAINRRANEAYVTTEAGEKRVVQLGIEGAESIEILSGLSDGERIKLNTDEAASRWRQGGK
ncbi:MAG TPA: efflux RND transporter periplasmic adaptor subunit [Tepidisphaeraceae bacterium]